jgi:Flp pilus assembly protein TadD
MRPLSVIFIAAQVAAALAAGDRPASFAARTPEAPPEHGRERVELRYVGSREVVLTYSADEAAPVDAVELWFRRGPEQPWALVEAEALHVGSLIFRAPDDGEYEFHLILLNAAGASGPSPTMDASPHARVMVDTTAPMVQIHHAEIRSLAALDRRLLVELTVTDEHLGPAGVRLFYRPSADAGTEDGPPWRDAGAVEVKDGRFKWAPPAELVGELDVRVIATDLAGNQSADERLNVPTVLISATTQPALDAPQAANEGDDIGMMAHVAPVEVTPVTPVGSAPDAAGKLLAEEPNSRRPDRNPEAAAAAQEARRLAEMAARHLRAREYDLAEARFRDGLKLVPNDPDLLSGLGGVLYRMEHFDEAATQFASALLAEPDHIGALEGYALVDATQRRYPEARKRLGQLLRIQPRSARHWLHYGDIEHKLGNTREALDAWNKAVGLENAPAEIVEQGRRRLKYFDTAAAAP